MSRQSSVEVLTDSDDIFFSIKGSSEYDSDCDSLTTFYQSAAGATASAARSMTSWKPRVRRKKIPFRPKSSGLSRLRKLSVLTGSDAAEASGLPCPPVNKIQDEALVTVQTLPCILTPKLFAIANEALLKYEQAQSALVFATEVNIFIYFK